MEARKCVAATLLKWAEKYHIELRGARLSLRLENPFEDIASAMDT